MHIIKIKNEILKSINVSHEFSSHRAIETKSSKEFVTTWQLPVSYAKKTQPAHASFVSQIYRIVRVGI